RQQAGHGGAARMFGTQDLPQKYPQRHQGRKDPVQPPTERCQRLFNDLLREDIGEGQIFVLDKLPSEKADLFAKRAWISIAHPWASLPVMELLPNPIYANEVLFAYVICRYGLAEQLSAIRRCDLST